MSERIEFWELVDPPQPPAEVPCPYWHGGKTMWFKTWEERAQHLRDVHGWMGRARERGEQ